MKTHSYVTFIRSLEMFGERELANHNDFFEISKFAISINQRINDLIKRAYDERIEEMHALEGKLITTGMAFIKKFVVKNKSVNSTPARKLRDALLKNLPDKFSFE